MFNINDDYMNWLENFTNNVPVFIEEEFLDPIPLQIGEENAKYGKYIHLLYDLVVEYAKKNYLNPNYDENNSPSYVIRYNGNFYEIGEDLEWFREVYCRRLAVYNDDFIDYLDIKNNTNSLKKDIIKKQLDSLANIIWEYSNYIPFSTLSERVEETIQNIKVKKFGSR